jgi:SAM-dependent methyltransferase
MQVNVDVDQLRSEIQEKYAEVAETPEKGFHFHTGYRLTEILDYPSEFINQLPASAVESFAGVGNPWTLGPVEEGWTVVDIGSGAGLDTLIAGGKVGAAGHVIGVDMTVEMLEKARANADQLGYGHVEFREGLAETLSVDDASVDLVISNGVINLVPDKSLAYQEVFRVLRPGGRAYIADVIVHKPVEEEDKKDISLWTG